MINFFRSLLGWRGPANTRTVAGNQVTLDRREAAYIQDSNTRLQALFNLGKRYKGTPQEARMQAVYEKTKTIHTYLVARKRSQELELFHLQHTDHFINTFNVIWQAHQIHPEGLATAPAPEQAIPLPEATITKERKVEERNKRQEPVHATNGRVSLPLPEEPKAQIPRLAAPNVRINPNAKVLYPIKEPNLKGETTKEIGFTSPALEKESFQAHISARFGIRNIAYMGNALVNIPDTAGPTHTGLVPIIQWAGSLYALNLNDNRLFPVKFGEGTP
jgi:hypothetical protein